MNIDPKTNTDESVESDKLPTPFFARFLESQEEVLVDSDVKAGAPWPPFQVTMKWPSDNDEDGILS